MMDKYELHLTINNVFNKFLFFSNFSKTEILKKYDKIRFKHDQNIKNLISYYRIDCNSHSFDYEGFCFFIFNILKKEFDKTKTPVLKKKKRNEDFKKYLDDNHIITEEYLNFFESDFIDFIFYHGSVGDRSFQKGISDVDVVIGFNLNFIKTYNSFKENILQLYKYNLYLLKVDSLQHHGFQSFFSFQRNTYFKHYFPEELIINGECLLGEFETSSLRSYDKEKLFLKKIVMESIRLNKEFFLGAYKQKALYSTLLMIMIYRVQLKQGLFGFKPYILDLISKNSGRKEIKLLKRLTLFRLKSSYISMFSAVNILEFLILI